MSKKEKMAGGFAGVGEAWLANPLVIRYKKHWLGLFKYYLLIALFIIVAVPGATRTAL